MTVSPAREDRGLVLFAALWVIALLGLLAHGMLRDSVVTIHAEHNAWMRAVMERDAETGLALALLWLTDTRETARWRPGAPAREADFDGARLTFSIDDELGKIDLNTADDALLKGLFISLGIAHEEASRISETILKRRSPVDEKDGGKGRFERIGELKSVEGIDTILFEKAAPALTVYSQARWIDPATAPLEALKAQPGIDTVAAEQIIAERASKPYFPPYQWATRSVSVDMQVSRGTSRLRVKAVLRPTPDGRKPYLLLAWTMIGP